MDRIGQVWAVVLAGGQGSRLASITRASDGGVVPKQFCSLGGGPTLIELAVRRANAVVPCQNTFAVVAADQRRWWHGGLGCLACRDNLIVEPHHRGSAHAILLAMLQILKRDPDACVVILPSDHHVTNEGLLAKMLKNAINQIAWRLHDVLILGMEATRQDADLGFILPGEEDENGTSAVVQFIEKPHPRLAEELQAMGALWNSFIVLATVRSFVSLYARHAPLTVHEMRSALEDDAYRLSEGDALETFYRRSTPSDFCTDILQGQETCLRVMPVPECGWSDLGTADRVKEALIKFPGRIKTNIGPGHHVDLAERIVRDHLFSQT